jgi:hypothetical protein
LKLCILNSTYENTLYLPNTSFFDDDFLRNPRTIEHKEIHSPTTSLILNKQCNMAGKQGRVWLISL